MEQVATAPAMKRCFACAEEKALGDFYKNVAMADGHFNKCKECTKADVRRNRAQKLDYYRDYDRQRGNRQSPDYLTKYREEFPGKYKAHNMVNNYLRDGKLTAETSCAACGADDSVHAHHDDYAKPLDVRWLCPACHKAWHVLHGEAPNGR